MLWMDDKLCEKKKKDNNIPKICFADGILVEKWCDWSENNFSCIKVQNKEKN